MSALLPNIYADEFARVARTAFSMWNRDPASPSYGSFDRQYWGWKYKDFSDATLQYAVRLAVEFAKGLHKTSMLPSLLDGYVTFCGNIQRRDGSFDQCYPYERTPGVVYDILSTLIYVRQSPYLVSDKSRADLEDIIANAARFALRTDEKHGSIANHLAEYAYELFNFARYANDDRARSRAEDYLERTLSLFEADEGWFQEYDGPDTGYQTRTLRYLSKIAELNEQADLWPVISRSAEFVRELMMPDGSLHPILGSRSTALLYPSAFEVLARREGRFRPLACKVREAWSARRVPLPSEIDFCNAIRLADDALEAAVVSGADSGAAAEEFAAADRVDFLKAGIAIRRSSILALYVNWRMGGVVVVYSRSKDGWKLAYEDSGYVLKADRKTACWLTSVPGAGELVEVGDDRMVIKARFYRSLHDELTPMHMVALRILNLTLLRVQWLGDLFRRMVVGRLMGERESLPLTLQREVGFEDGVVKISDRIVPGNLPGAARGAALYRCRRATGIHMASARYFQEQELDDAGGSWAARLADNVTSEYAHTLRIGATPDA